MGRPIKTLSIDGFKSIRQLEAFPLERLNVLIGANGAGKSNFVDFFRLLRSMADENLQGFVNRQGGADGFFHLGPKSTPAIKVELRFGDNGFKFSLEPTANNEILVGEEWVQYTGGKAKGYWNRISQGRPESGLAKEKNTRSDLGPWPSVGSYVYAAVSNWSVYHFHDTSSLAPMRRDQPVRDFDRLRPDASNIAAYLLRLKSVHPEVYERIRDTLRLIAPFFADFRLLAEDRGNNGEEKVRLEWTQKGSDFPFQPYQLSDGTIRFICLATALLQPDPPATIVVDEPELGLHPHALEILGALLRQASQRMQVIVSTQSAVLLSLFGPADVIVVDRAGAESQFRRLDAAALKRWLADYTLGELWQKNLLGGQPHNDSAYPPEQTTIAGPLSSGGGGLE